jgi:hypothetical protein
VSDGVTGTQAFNINANGRTKRRIGFTVQSSRIW